MQPLKLVVGRGFTGYSVWIKSPGTADLSNDVLFNWLLAGCKREQGRNCRTSTLCRGDVCVCVCVQYGQGLQGWSWQVAHLQVCILRHFVRERVHKSQRSFALLCQCRKSWWNNYYEEITTWLLGEHCNDKDQRCEHDKPILLFEGDREGARISVFFGFDQSFKFKALLLALRACSFILSQVLQVLLLDWLCTKTLWWSLLAAIGKNTRGFVAGIPFMIQQHLSLWEFSPSQTPSLLGQN